MDRAEQIKAILKQQSAPPPPLSTPLPLRRDLVPSCCSAGVESQAYYYGKYTKLNKYINNYVAKDYGTLTTQAAAKVA
jgi:hypothetical protein